jgi:DNA-binding FadR family transcriptional regulator
MDADATAETSPARFVDRLRADVSDFIRRNALERGATLPSEAAAAARSGVSRAVAREGFRGSAALRLIDVGPGPRGDGARPRYDKAAGSESSRLRATVGREARPLCNR